MNIVSKKYTLFFCLTFLLKISVYSQYLLHEGIQRHYLLHIPKNIPANKKVPLLICMHGRGGTADNMQSYFKVDPYADRDTFMVVYPEGIDNRWTDGRATVGVDDSQRRPDDVGFINKLIDTLIRNYPVDVSRIYAAGVSNGGVMSYRLGVALKGKIKGIASFVANVGEDFSKKNTPSVPIDVMIVNGTADPIMPYEGGYVKIRGQLIGPVLSTEQSAQYFAKAFSCDQKPNVSPMIDHDKKDDTSYYTNTYTCPLSKIKVITVVNGGHAIPGKKQYLPKMFIGIASKEFDGAEEVIKFFGL
jgi:polyhydroxybutyrate depolymerase